MATGNDSGAQPPHGPEDFEGENIQRDTGGRREEFGPAAEATSADPGRNLPAAIRDIERAASMLATIYWVAVVVRIALLRQNTDTHRDIANCINDQIGSVAERAIDRLAMAGQRLGETIWNPLDI
jgi:hypothetical protein